MAELLKAKAYKQKKDQDRYGSIPYDHCTQEVQLKPELHEGTSLKKINHHGLTTILCFSFSYSFFTFSSLFVNYLFRCQ